MGININDEKNMCFGWDINYFKETLDRLEALPCSSEVKQECALLQLLINLLEVDCYQQVETNDIFSSRYLYDRNVLHEYYADYIGTIFDFYHVNMEMETDTIKLADFQPDYEEILNLLMDFFRKLDKDWYLLCQNLYKIRYSAISFQSIPSFSAFLPEANIWIANIKSSHSISVAVDLAHEFAHGIGDQLHHDIQKYSPENILLELFPLLCQSLFIDYLIKIKYYPDEAKKFKKHVNQSILNQAEEICFKFNISQLFPTIKNARNLSRVIKRELNMSISKDELMVMYNQSVAHNIHYVYPFIICNELLSLVYEDFDYFKYATKILMKENEDVVDTIRKLKLMPNQHKLDDYD